MRLALGLCAALLLALPACGGDDGGGGGGGDATEPAEWASQVCGAVGTWLGDVQQRSSEIGQKAQASGSLEETKTEFVAFFDGLVERTDQMLGEIEDAGNPDVENGEEIGAEFRATIEPIRDAFADAREDAEQLPTDDPQAFAEGAVRAGESVQKEGDEIGKAFDSLGEKYQSDELEQAFEDEPACKELSNA